MSEYHSQVEAHKARRQRFEMAAAKYSGKQIDDKQAELLDCWILPSTLPPIPNRAMAIAVQIAFPPANQRPVFVMNQIEAVQIATLREYPGITMIDLKSERRTDKIVRPRQIAMYLSKMLTGKSLPDIGRRFGGRDHSTVIFAIRKIAALIESDHVLAAQIERIKENIPDVGGNFD